MFGTIFDAYYVTISIIVKKCSVHLLPLRTKEIWLRMSLLSSQHNNYQFGQVQNNNNNMNMMDELMVFGNSDAIKSSESWKRNSMEIYIWCLLNERKPRIEKHN